MGKLRTDASQRTFFDQYERIKASYFRARDVIDPAKNVALIPCADGTTKALAVTHTRFPSGGGWSFFRCPQCDRRASVIYLVNNAPLCVECCSRLNIRYASKWAFGRAERRRAADLHLDQLIAKLEATERLRIKPAPASWGGRAQTVYNSRKLTKSMRKAMVALRLSQLAEQHERARAKNEDTLTTHQPIEATRQLIDLAPIWKANSPETLAQALDKAQLAILAALESDDPQQRLNAVKLMMRTKQARDRGL